MSQSFYDAVFLGNRLSCMLAATLLAKRGFRVLVLGQGELPPDYRSGPYTLPRSPFAFVPAHSPVARRIFGELAIGPHFRRRAHPCDPLFQVALPGQRIDLHASQASRDRELDREFPDVRRALEDFHRGIVAASEELDRLIERDLMWPPSRLLERREFARAASHPRFDRNGNGADPLAELPEGHPFRSIMRLPVRFSDGMDPDHGSVLRDTRLYGHWLRGVATLDGGAAELHQMLLDRLVLYGGEIRARDRAEHIVIRRNHAVAVRIAASSEEIGTGYVVGGRTAKSLLRLLPDRRPFDEIFERIGEPQVRYFRYTVNAVLRREGLPPGVGRHVFFLRDPKLPMAGENALHIERRRLDEERELLCVGALLPRRSVEEASGYLDSIRDRVRSSLEELMPFLDDHLEWVDSPHDGRDAEDIPHRASRSSEEPWTRGRGAMAAVCGYPVTTALGVCALPVHTPVRHLLLCSEQVAPGLGMEGEMLAAWSCARVITRSDRRKEWMKRGLWTRVET
jgi:phytoene dehydrogenase-like protein